MHLFGFITRSLNGYGVNALRRVYAKQCLIVSSLSNEHQHFRFGILRGNFSGFCYPQLLSVKVRMRLNTMLRSLKSEGTCSPPVYSTNGRYALASLSTSRTVLSYDSVPLQLLKSRHALNPIRACNHSISSLVNILVTYNLACQ